MGAANCVRTNPGFQTQSDGGQTGETWREQDPEAVLVTLHIYELGAGQCQALNGILKTCGAGAVHCGVEVFGVEWTFAESEDVHCNSPSLKKNQWVWPNGMDTGVVCCRPMEFAGHTYSSSLSMGCAFISRVHVGTLINVLQRQWQSADYDLLMRNCCHFCDEFCVRLGVGHIPPWVMRLAGVGESLKLETKEILNCHCCKEMASGVQVISVAPDCVSEPLEEVGDVMDEHTPWMQR
jgi:hypothetical protein